jgi:hypothetical protein
MLACVLAFALATKPSDFGDSIVEDAGGDVCANAAVSMINAALMLNTIHDNNVARVTISSQISRRSEKLRSSDPSNPALQIFQ